MQFLNRTSLGQIDSSSYRSQEAPQSAPCYRNYEHVLTSFPCADPLSENFAMMPWPCSSARDILKPKAEPLYHRTVQADYPKHPHSPCASRFPHLSQSPTRYRQGAQSRRCWFNDQFRSYRIHGFGLAKQLGVGQIKDADRIAIRLPALCGTPTRTEAEHVLKITVAEQRELTDQFISLTKQRRERPAHPKSNRAVEHQPSPYSCRAISRLQKPAKRCKNN